MSQKSVTKTGQIAFGTIAKAKRVLSTELSSILQLNADDRLRSYTEKLVKDGLVYKSGNTKCVRFYVNPQLMIFPCRLIKIIRSLLKFSLLYISSLNSGESMMEKSNEFLIRSMMWWVEIENGTYFFIKKRR